MQRRILLKGLLVAPFMLALTRSGRAAPQGGVTMSVEALHKNWLEYLADGADVVLTTEPLQHSESEWKDILTPQQFAVLRREGTERPFSSGLNDEKRAGVYVCIGCRLPLFTSAMKFDSGTGWPSFFTTIPSAFATKRDFQLLWPRTEYHCVRCGGHHGHVFDDGPPPTGERWCNNGVVLRFIPKTGSS